MELRGKVTVITGAGSGIGAACARSFATEGAKVVVADVNEAGANAVAKEVAGLGVRCDVRSKDDIEALVAAAEKKFGPVDVFFSNAGVANGTDPLETALDVWQQQWEIHVMSHVHAVRALLPKMLERGSGYFLQTASMAGILMSHGGASYTTTKHAAVGLAKWLSVTYHDQGIRSSLLAPLGVRTPMLGDVSAPFARLAAGPIKEPEEVAAIVVEGIREERFLILTDPIAQKWIEQMSADTERWLKGMRRMWARMVEEMRKGAAS